MNCKDCKKEISKKSKSFLCRSCAKLGKNNPMYGKNHKEISKKKISKVHKGKTLSKDLKNKLSELKQGKGVKHQILQKYGKIEGNKRWEEYCDKYLRGENHRFYGLTGEKAVFYGKKHTEETKRKMSEIRTKFLSTTHPIISKPEKKVKRFFDKNNISYMQQVKIKNRVFDFYLPKQNILIEVDGCYWHGKPEKYKVLNETQKEHKKIDQEKNKLAKEQGYKLIRIWEDEIDKEWRII